MSTATVTAPTTVHVTGWDRGVVIALGAAGCALSYDALQQMAVAIHVRGFLTYLFPLVIDGFIAYGVRALLVMRDAPYRARAYCWTLFGAATTASLWANALHAVRLNQQSTAADGLRLGDTVVAVLSTIAPLALAGAVHLYILIARGSDTPADRNSRAGRNGSGDLGQATAAADRSERVTALTGGADSNQVTAGHLGAGRSVGRPMTDRADRPRLTSAGPVTATDRADLGGQPDNARSVSDRPTEDALATAASVSPVTASSVTDRAAREVGDRSADRDTEELLKIANKAVEAANNKLTRQIVAQAIRGEKRTLSSDTLTQLMAQLREQQRQRQLAPASRD
ncbi:DUF2637 domain-containing protein [Kitasatospora sp. NPDC090091]|uniref:DUF2637 domain-containing protein n=1 Tax=Kitasatospora sp. NPDC090091 TaxID=3364081 RepID=UPI003823919B